MSKASRAISVALAPLLISLVGCTHSTIDRESAHDLPSPGIAVDGTSDASAATGGFRVTVPASSVAGKGTLRVAQDATAPAVAAGLTRVGAGVRVDLSGARLDGRAAVSFAVPTNWSQNQLPIIAWQDGRGGWRWLPTRWKPEQKVATAETDHFSTGFLGSFDIGAKAKEVSRQLASWFTGRSDVAQPSCAAEQSARAKLRISSDGGDSVKWCLGVERGETVLKVANNRLSYTQVTYPKTWKVMSGGGYGISLDGLVKLTSTKAATALLRPGRTAILIDAGKTVTFAVPNDESHAVAENSFYAYALQILGLALDVETKVAALAGIELKKNGIDRLIGIITGESKLDEWGKAARDCLRSFTNEFTDDLMAPVELNETAKKMFGFVGECVVAMGRVSATESGPLIFPVSVVLDGVMTLVTTLITAVRLVIVGIREVWDSLASFGGRSNPIYAIDLAPRMQPTTIVRIAPFTASGALRSSYDLESFAAPLSCMPFGPTSVLTSPSAVSDNIYFCGSTADNADVCWIDPDSRFATCGDEPWDHRLSRRPLAEFPIPSVQPPRKPDPWGLVLADGTRCRRRIGGSWSGRPDGWIPAYGCTGSSMTVLSDPAGRVPDVDRSRPTWVVRIGTLSDTARSLPPPRPVAVKLAYYAGR